METQPGAAPDAPKDGGNLPSSTLGTDDELLELFSPNDPDKSSFYSSRLTEEEHYSENVTLLFCWSG